MKKRAEIFPTVFISLVLFGSGCGGAHRDAATEPPSMASETPSALPIPPGPTHSVTEITRSPKALIGKTVTVVADVDEVYGPRAFELEEDAPQDRGVDNDLLALIPKVGDFPSVDDQWKDGKARVTGVVYRMAPKDIEREIGWVLPSSLESKFKGKPVLIARSVERLTQ